jgi:putative PIN family toxin of toxin-antitoxin system
VVLDANVLASGVVGFLNPTSVPGQILRAWQANQFELVTSRHVIEEVERALQKSYFRARLTHDQVSVFHRTLQRQTTLIPIRVPVHGVAAHPSDDLVLATAVSAQADYLVTGDGRFRRQVRSYQGVDVVSPAEFLAILETQ